MLRQTRARMLPLPEADAPHSPPTAVVVPFPRSPAATEARRQAVEALCREHHPRLVQFLTLRLGNADEAQEAAQEAYLRVLNATAASAERDNLRALLYVSARNIAIDRLRERSRREPWVRDDFDGEQLHAAATTLGPERIVEAEDSLRQVVSALEELPARCRYAFIRYKFHGSDYDLIASEMGVTQSMVRKYVIKAIAFCAKRLLSADGEAQR